MDVTTTRFVLGALLLALAAVAGDAEAGAWVLPAGRGWGQLALLHQQTDERYFLDGERTPYFFEGRNRTTALFLDLRYGLGGRVEIGAQMPLYRVQFDDLADDRRSFGPGDLRVAGRVNLQGGPLVATLGLAVKSPTGEFVNDAEIVPIGEGQWDLDITAELGHSFWPRPAYVSLLAGYRLRGTNHDNGISPGDEFFWSAEAEHRLRGSLNLKAVARGLHGQRSTSFGLEIPTLRREVVYLQPGLVWQVDAVRGVELSVPFTVKGRNWPAGWSVGLGFYSGF